SAPFSALDGPGGLWHPSGPRAGVVELVDAPDSKSGTARCVGSIPTARTNKNECWLHSFLCQAAPSRAAVFLTILVCDRSGSLFARLATRAGRGPPAPSFDLENYTLSGRVLEN